MTPSAIRRFNSRNSGFQRSTKLTTVSTPAALTAACIRASSSELLANGLLDHQMLAGLGGRDDILAVQVLRRADRDDVDPRMAQGGREIVVKGRIVQARLRRSTPGALDRAAADRQDLGLWIRRIGGKVLSGHPAGAVNQNSKRFAIMVGSPVTYRAIVGRVSARWE